MNEREKQIEWLTTKRQQLLEMAKDLEQMGDVMLPRGFALGCSVRAAEKVLSAAVEMENAIAERRE